MRTVRLDSLRPNERNPRRITPAALEMLRKSIERDPAFLELRPIIVDEAGEILGGHQRYRALLELGHVEVPAAWVRVAVGLSAEQRARFLIVDNAPEGMSGFWDFEALAATWDLPELVDLGFRFAEPVDVAELWKGMPEFQQEDLAPHRTLPVHFASDADVEEFGRRIGQTITPNARSIWFPPAEIGRIADKRYAAAPPVEP